MKHMDVTANFQYRVTPQDICDYPQLMCVGGDGPHLLFIARVLDGDSLKKYIYCGRSDVKTAISHSLEIMFL